MTRIGKGFSLFQRGNVKLISYFPEDKKNHQPEEYQFEVKSKKTVYLVSFIDGVARCNECQDYSYRFQREGNSKNGSFLCGHIYAAIFMLGKIKGTEDQTNLEDQLLKVQSTSKDMNFIIPDEGELGHVLKINKDGSYLIKLVSGKYVNAIPKIPDAPNKKEKGDSQ